ncbi:MAG: hypothetical protein ACXABY_19095 [Candidatus Thorarchaeota archaeon]|jgi:hypothetical protein
MAKEDKPVADVPQDGITPAQDSPDPVDDAYKDKSLEDIIKMHKELKSHSDRQLEQIKAEKDKEIAAKEKDLQAWESWRQSQAAHNPQPTQQTPPVDQSKLVDALLENPIETLNQFYTHRKTQDSFQEAWQDGPSVLAEAKKRSPGTFEGIDEEYLNNIMYGGLQAGNIKPHEFKKPEAWVMGAWQLKGVKNDFTTAPPPPIPPTPPQGDLPPGVRPQVGEKDTDDIEFDPLTHELREAFGKTKEQAAKMITDWRTNPDPRMRLTNTKE